MTSDYDRLQVLFKTVVQLGFDGAQSRGVAFVDLLRAVGNFCLIFIGSILIGVIGGAAIALLFKVASDCH